MKRIAFKVLRAEVNDQEITLNYHDQLMEVMRHPLNQQAGIGIDEMRRAVRVLNALDAARDDHVDLEDADYEALVQHVNAFRWPLVLPIFLEFTDDVTHAETLTP